MLVAAAGRGGQVEPGRRSVAGFDPVGTFIGVKKSRVGVRDFGDSGVGGPAREDIVILREVVEQMPPQDVHVVGGGQVPLGCQAVCIPEGGVIHSQLAGGPRHSLGEGSRIAADVVPDGRGRIVGRLDRRSPNKIAQGDLLPRL